MLDCWSVFKMFVDCRGGIIPRFVCRRLCLDWQREFSDWIADERVENEWGARGQGNSDRRIFPEQPCTSFIFLLVLVAACIV